MYSSLVKCASEYVKELEHMREIQSKRLDVVKDYQSILLRGRDYPGRNSYYCACNKGEDSFKYLGSNSNETVCRIKESRYLHKSVGAIENNIKLLNRTISGLRPVDYDSINNSLPKTYRNAAISVADSKDSKSLLWKEKAEALKARYDVFREEELVVPTDDMSKVRSKSEALIYNYLLSMGVTFSYELPLRLRTGSIWPDFTLLSEIDNETEIIIEHQGMMNNAHYRNRFNEKLFKYLQNGYVPGVNVFFTFDGLNGSLDLSPIRHIVNNVIRQ